MSKIVVIEEWILSDGVGEYVAYYNPTGHVMHFTRRREEARVWGDSHEAFFVERVVRELYRREMGMMMVCSEVER